MFTQSQGLPARDDTSGRGQSNVSSLMCRRSSLQCCCVPWWWCLCMMLIDSWLFLLLGSRSVNLWAWNEGLRMIPLFSTLTWPNIVLEHAIQKDLVQWYNVTRDWSKHYRAWPFKRQFNRVNGHESWVLDLSLCVCAKTASIWLPSASMPEMYLGWSTY